MKRFPRNFQKDLLSEFLKRFNISKFKIDEPFLPAGVQINSKLTMNPGNGGFSPIMLSSFLVEVIWVKYQFQAVKSTGGLFSEMNARIGCFFKYDEQKDR